MYVSTGATLINCTLSDNDGGGIMVEDQDGVSLANCVVWGNGPFQLAEDPDFPGGPIMVANSDVEGGWPGPGNIDADPWFVQPGTDNLRLSFGSPCVNAGDDAALPPDEFDLDNDGNTSEPIPVDLDGNPRSQAGAVDMGAYEGESEPMDPAAAEGGFDQGEGTILVPAGDTPDPLQNAMVFVVNTSGPDNATFTPKPRHDVGGRRVPGHAVHSLRFGGPGAGRSGAGEPDAVRPRRGQLVPGGDQQLR
jgi:parallel beta-helix repeat protein